jgi:hypothetical protein
VDEEDSKKKGKKEDVAHGVPTSVDKASVVEG